MCSSSLNFMAPAGGERRFFDGEDGRRRVAGVKGAVFRDLPLARRKTGGEVPEDLGFFGSARVAGIKHEQ